jgi:hypothetical protein
MANVSSRVHTARSTRTWRIDPYKSGSDTDSIRVVLSDKQVNAGNVRSDGNVVDQASTGLARAAASLRGRRSHGSMGSSYGHTPQAELIRDAMGQLCGWSVPPTLYTDASTYVKKTTPDRCHVPGAASVAVSG